MLHTLVAREYKLLLNPNSFGNEPNRKIANQFWEETIRPIVTGSIGERANGKPRHEKSFEKADRRCVAFYDDLERKLSGNFYSLRARAPLSGRDAEIQLTLKYRTPDYFVVAGTPQRGAVAGAETQLEEDIAPLELAAEDASGVVTSDPVSVRSRFSLSTTLTHDRLQGGVSLSDITKLFRGLQSNLPKSATQHRADPRLEVGPQIVEDVFKGPKVILGDGLEAKFSLTLWRLSEKAPVSSIAEISYRCATPNGEMTRGAARRAFDLFIGLQKGLGDLVERRFPSKTALALPRILQ